MAQNDAPVPFVLSTEYPRRWLADTRMLLIVRSMNGSWGQLESFLARVLLDAGYDWQAGSQEFIEGAAKKNPHPL